MPDSEVKALFDLQAEAIRTRDVDRLMSLYSPDIVYYDVVPPLQYVGSAALRGRFHHWFSSYQGSLKVETRDRHIMTSGDMAVACWFSRVSGLLKNGETAGFWVRVTSCCQRSASGWLITHEHVSLPVDVMSGKAERELVP